MGCFYQDKMCIFSITKGLTNKLVACILISEIQIQIIHVLNLVHHVGFLANIYMAKMSYRPEYRFFNRLNTHLKVQWATRPLADKNCSYLNLNLGVCT